MSALLPVNVNGVQFQAQGEYTSSAVASQFQHSLAAFVNIFNLGLDNSVTGVTANNAQSVIDKIKNDPTYASQLLAALVGGTVTTNYGINPAVNPNKPEQDHTVVGLLNLLKNGMLVTDDPVLRPGQSYLSLEMAGAVDQLIRSMQMAGINIQSDGSGGLQVVGGITADQVLQWRNLTASSTAIQQILQYATDASGNQNRTLQALVELIYVKTGNEVLSNTLESLEGALTTTNQALNSLANLQDLLNKVTAKDKEKFQDVASILYQSSGQIPTAKTTGTSSGDRSTIKSTFRDRPLDPTTFVRGSEGNAFPGVNSAADTHFAPIDPTLLSMLTESDRIEFLSTRKDIMQEIAFLSGQSSDSQGTLVANLRKVLQDINKAFSAVGIPASGIESATSTKVTSALTRWVLDSQGADFTGLNIPGSEPGQIQRNLTAAVTSGQSLNSTQSDKVRQYLFVFEEYYKSAAAILNSITQLIQRMAQAISR